MSYFIDSVIAPLSQMRLIFWGPTFWQVLNRDLNRGSLAVTPKLLIIACKSLPIKIVLYPKRHAEADPVRKGTGWRSESGERLCTYGAILCGQSSPFPRCGGCRINIHRPWGAHVGFSWARGAVQAHFPGISTMNVWTGSMSMWCGSKASQSE